MKQMTTFSWQGRSIRLCYEPRQWTVIDHVDIYALDERPLPITSTGYRSHFFGPVEPALTLDEVQETLDEVQELVIRMLDEAATTKDWQDYLAKSAQLSFF